MAQKLKLFQIDAFTDQLFGGNPAAVCLLDYWLEDALLQRIASENFLPETAFFVPNNEPGYFELRWFTPDIEMDLCGHATLATAHVLYNHLGFNLDTIYFRTKSGILKVSEQNELLALDFPSRMPVPSILPNILANAFGTHLPTEIWKSRDYVLIFESEEIIRQMKPDRRVIDQINLDPGGIVVTARGNETDFVSRFFTPQSTIFEDPVTGSAHCSLIPLWARKLGKKKLTAMQLSLRKGKLFCEDLADRVLIAGKAKTYLEGTIYV